MSYMTSAPKFTSAQLSQAFKSACMAELSALKPGNVHIFADGHGMKVQDFVASAEAAARVIAEPEMSLGQRIFSSVQVTQQAVSCNTNLGMILLCAPLLQAQMMSELDALQPNIHEVIRHADCDDAELVFAAIRLASPGGLGAAKEHDVQQTANCTLLQAMQAAAHRDMIAKQFVTDFSDVFAAILVYEHLVQAWQRPAWAATGVHLYFMSHFLDSHIVRKQGEVIASMVQAEAIEHYHAFLNTHQPKNYQTPLITFDLALKKRGINPGTSADLTVATLLLRDLTRS
jgi:triphosphoribosyl-dephospho-CoA synthase